MPPLPSGGDVFASVSVSKNTQIEKLKFYLQKFGKTVYFKHDTFHNKLFVMYAGVAGCNAVMANSPLYFDKECLIVEPCSPNEILENFGEFASMPEPKTSERAGAYAADSTRGGSRGRFVQGGDMRGRGDGVTGSRGRGFGSMGWGTGHTIHDTETSMRGGGGSRGDRGTGRVNMRRYGSMGPGKSGRPKSVPESSGVATTNMDTSTRGGVVQRDRGASRGASVISQTSPPKAIAASGHRAVTAQPVSSLTSPSTENITSGKGAERVAEVDLTRCAIAMIQATKDIQACCTILQRQIKELCDDRSDFTPGTDEDLSNVLRRVRDEFHDGKSRHGIEWMDGVLHGMISSSTITILKWT